MQDNKYRVRECMVAGVHYWFVYKLKSVCVPDETGNRLYKGSHFESEAEAKRYADLLNAYGDD